MTSLQDNNEVTSLLSERHGLIDIKLKLSMMGFCSSCPLKSKVSFYTSSSPLFLLQKIQIFSLLHCYTFICTYLHLSSYLNMVQPCKVGIMPFLSSAYSGEPRILIMKVIYKCH